MRGRIGMVRKYFSSWPWWLISVIPGTRDTEIQRIGVQGQPGQKVNETSFQSIS
jgi:hypothetical protein